MKSLLPSCYDCVLLKCFRGKEATPIHLDHNLFDSQFTALLDADPTSDIVVYNTQTHLYFREGVNISNAPRFSTFVWCRSKIQKQNRLVVLCRRTSPGFTCHCGGELCIQRILHASTEREEIQKEFVDQVVMDCLFYVVLRANRFVFRSVHNQILQACECVHSVFPQRDSSRYRLRRLQIHLQPHAESGACASKRDNWSR